MTEPSAAPPRRPWRWRSLGEGVVTGGDAAQWRLLAWLWGLGGMLALLASLFGVDPEADPVAIGIVGLSSVLGGGVLMALAERLPVRLIGPVLVLGTTVVSAATLAAGEPDSPFVLLFTWVGAEAWYFLSARAALAFSAYAIALSGVVMLAIPTDEQDAAAWWLLSMGSLLVIGVLSAALRIRSDRLVGRLSAAAIHDELTGALNVRGYRERLHEEVERARRFGVPVSVVLGDLDRFKALNDRFGHRAGDQALRDFAAICRRHLRDIDVLGRVGGEEFSIVLPGTDAAAAVVAAERLREAVRAELRDPEGGMVTASFGVAGHPHHGDAAETLLEHADQAMYAAKATGRDRTVGFRPGLPRERTPGGDGDAATALAETLVPRDAARRAHAEAVARTTEQIAVALGLPDEAVRDVRLAGLLHGAGLHHVAGWVLEHHEAPDGRGDEIPLEARILAMADAHPAMTARRPGR